jgi:hypothetical protein
MRVTAAGETRRVTRAGFTVVVPFLEAPPLEAEPITQEILTAGLTPLEGGLDPQTTTLTIPVDEDIEDTQLSELGSDNEPQLLIQLSPDGDPVDGDGNLVDPGDGNLIDPIVLEPPIVTEVFTGQVNNDTSTAVDTSQRDALTCDPDTNPDACSSEAAAVVAAQSLPSTGFTGRFKTPLVSGTINDARTLFTATAMDGKTLIIPLGSPGGTFSFSNVHSGTLLGQISGTSTLSADGEFLYFDITELENANALSTGFSGIATPSSAVPTSGTTRYLLSRDYVQNSNVPFVRGTDGGTIAPVPSGDNSGIIWSSGSTRGTFGFLTATVDGTGTAQKSVVSLMSGQVLLASNGQPYLSGDMRGSSQLSATTSPLTMHSMVASTPDGSGNHFYGADNPDYFALQPATVNTTDASTTSTSAESITGTTTASYSPTSYALRPTNDTAFIEHPRTARSLSGFAGGLEWILNSGGGVNSINPKLTFQDDPSKISIVTNPSNNSLMATFIIGDPGSGSNSLTFRFGDSGTPTGRSLFIDDQGFGAIESATSSLINGNAAASAYSYMFSGSIDGDFLPAGVTFCQDCEALAWGFWGGRLITSSDQHHDFHLGTWVAGEIPSAAEIAPFSGSATYTGHVAGNVLNGSNAYFAVGKFQTTWNFDTGSGATTVTSFDGANYSGTLNDFGTGEENMFSGTLNSTSGPTRSGSVAGAFFRTHGTANGSVGGHIKFSNDGPSYEAVTTFAATRH